MNDKMSSKKKAGFGALIALAAIAVVASLFRYKREWCNEQIEHFKAFFKKKPNKSVKSKD
ncbi:hypothetical protein KAJ89_04670 [Candidatus Parcubacteria bacterium]|nr:hypothetical protein [Candidatus Parcubacteria bacterium]